LTISILDTSTDDLHLKGIVDHDVVGALYEIERGGLTWARLREALDRQPHFDAIFSIRPGKLAVFLLHERKRYVVRA